MADSALLENFFSFFGVAFIIAPIARDNARETPNPKTISFDLRIST